MAHFPVAFCSSTMYYIGLNLIQNRCKIMPSGKLTDAFLRNIERPERGVLRFWDTEIGGFVAHVQKTATTLYYDRNNQRHARPPANSITGCGAATQNM
jgi:hypothetical protein